MKLRYLLLIFCSSLNRIKSQQCDTEGLVSVDDFHEYAERNLEPRALGFIDGAAMMGETLRDNRNAFQRYKIRPRYMRNVKTRQLSTNVLGFPVSLPVGLAPHASQRFAHPEGELATAKAAMESGAIMILSSYSTTSLEDVANAAPTAIRWIQLHVFSNRNLTLDLIRRAERTGYKAIVLTIDFPTAGVRYFSLKNKYFKPDGTTFANFDLYNQNRVSYITYSAEGQIGNFPDPATTWDDIYWLRRNTYLPIVVKGILTGEDANLAIESGAAAVYVSNHGGRQLDGAPATMDVLPEIIRAVNGRVEVYLDSGIRTGADVFKALALGAKAVFYGRPNMWGLSFHGKIGAKCVLDIMQRDLSVTMALAGFSTVESINNSAIVRDNYYTQNNNNLNCIQSSIFNHNKKG